MAVTQAQLDILEKHRTDLHTTVKGGLGGDEYLIATYSKLIRTLDQRIPVVKRMVEGSSRKAESKALLTEARATKGSTGSSTNGQPNQQRSA
jgi:hypothetical protein